MDGASWCVEEVGPVVVSQTRVVLSPPVVTSSFPVSTQLDALEPGGVSPKHAQTAAGSAERRARDAPSVQCEQQELRELARGEIVVADEHERAATIG
jgi:hypothetical protein